MTLFHWSRTAATNGTSDITCPFPEGMGAPALNDGARGMMAAVAKYRDDMAGAIVTGGTAGAYTVLSYQGFDNLADMHGQEIAFSPHATNVDTVILNVDGLGSKPLRSAPGVELLAGTLALGSPYVALYNNTDGVFYLKGYFSSPYNIPLFGGIDYWGGVAPNSSFIFPIGQAISRTVYASVFAVWGVGFGNGDGATTFNVPDIRGRVRAALDNMGGSAANRLTGYNGLGTNGGEQSHVLSVGEMPAHRHAVVLSDLGHAHGGALVSTNTYTSPGGATNVVQSANSGNTAVATTGITISDGAGTPNATSAVGSSTAHNNVQPTIACNYIIRIL